MPPKTTKQGTSTNTKGLGIGSKLKAKSKTSVSKTVNFQIPPLSDLNGTSGKIKRVRRIGTTNRNQNGRDLNQNKDDDAKKEISKPMTNVSGGTGPSQLPPEPYKELRYWSKGQTGLPGHVGAFGARDWHLAQESVREVMQAELDHPAGVYVKEKNRTKRAVENNQTYYRGKEGFEPKPISSREKALDICMMRYIKYVLLIRQLDECYRYLVHPQKRIMLKTTIEGAVVRMLEYREEMVNLDEREFQLFDHLLEEMGLTPDDMEVTTPQYFTEGRLDRVKSRTMILKNLLQKNFPGQYMDDDDDCRVYKEHMPLLDAVRLLQKNQRAFGGRQKYDKTKIKKMDLAYQRKMAANVKDDEDSTKADKLYRETKKWTQTWRTIVHKKKAERQREKELVDFDMMPALGLKQKDLVWKARVDKHIQRNTGLAMDYTADMHEEIARIEEDIIQTEGKAMAETLKQNILQWLLELKDLTGAFPQFPEEEEGGSLALFKNKTLDDVEDDIDEWLEDQAKPKKKGAEKEKKEKKKDKKADKKEGEAFSWTVPEGEGLYMLEEVENEFCSYWNWRDETCNWRQRFDQENLRERIKENVEVAIRREVDELMREELDRLKKGIEKTKEGKPKEKKKKEPKEKKKKGKGGVGLTADRTIEELYEELVEAEIVMPLKRRPMEEFLGTYEVSSCAQEDSMRHVMPSLDTVRRQVREMAIIPLSSAAVHERAPHVKSLLLAGHRGTGKDMLVDIMCHEAGANLFNITAANLEGKYEGAKEQAMLMHMLVKVGKAMEPTIILMDDCEKPFLKKKDKEDESKPFRWAKPLQGTIKKLKRGDRILFVGTTKAPWLCKPGPLFKCFQRMIYVPIPDHNSRYLLWQHFVTQKIGELFVRDVDITSLTQVTAGFTTQDIISACKEALTETRLSRLKRRGQLKSIEFIDRIVTFDPIYLDEAATMMDWYVKTPLIKLRIKRLTDEAMSVA